MKVDLLKKEGTYVGEDKKEKRYVNFFVRCGGTLIPIEVKYFPNKEDDRDYQYAGRREVMKAFADVLPEIEKSVDSSTTTEKRGNKPQLQSFDDDSDIQF